MLRTAKLRFIGIAVLCSVVGSLVGCNFLTPAPVTPLTNSKGEMIPKSFFMKKATFDGVTETRQTAMAGWAPIDERGQYAEAYVEHGVPSVTHVNIQWSITEKSLLGYLVNPSFSGTANHDTVFIEIPIARHYYYEKEKDGYQRETNRWIKNDQRDAWQFRPYMDLDFRGMKVTDLGVVTNLPAHIIDVTDFEWDYNKQYLAFTILASDALDTLLDGQAQAKFRMNFMSFDTDSGFQKTPYSDTTARFINVLHILGKQDNGNNQEAYAGHWKLPVTFYTYGVPPEYMQVVRDVFKEWNAAFVRAGVVSDGQAALILDENPRKYAFDLRYPVINWVADRRLSLNAPLGIGEASSDVTNGQFLFGSVTIWSGILDEYMNHYAGSSNGVDSGGVSADAYRALGERNKSFSISSMFDTGAILPLKNPNLGGATSITDFLKSPAAVDALRAAIEQVAGNSIKELQQNGLNNLANSNPALAQKIAQNLKEAESSAILQYGHEYLANVDADMLDFTGNSPAPDPFKVFADLYPSLSVKVADEEAMRDVCLASASNPALASLEYKGLTCKSTSVNVNDVTAQIQALYASDKPADADFTMADFAAQMAGVPKSSVRDERETLKATLKLLTLHELGHVLGLGHNFKGNIMPEQGTISEATYQQLKNTWLKHKNGESTTEMSTTVMDYGGGVTYANLNYDDVKPGPYDEMMLKYLYQSVYPAISDNGNDVKYFPIVGDNGVIPDVTPYNGKTYKTAFLPSCNDLDASFNLDPYCQRWDRGANAEEIVQARFKDFNAALPAMLNAFSGAKGGNAEYRTVYLWYEVLREFSATRVFYDLMRAELDSPKYPYRDAFAKISSDPQALYAFSQACLDPTKAPAGFEDAFAQLALRDPSKLQDLLANQDLRANRTTIDKLVAPDGFTQIHDLCAANELTLAEWGNLLSRKGSDYTTYDIFRRYVPGGMTAGDVNLDWGYIWGAYKEIGSFPLRLVTIYTLTTPKPFFLWGGLIDIPIYSGPEQSYSYASLYPREFSSIIGTAVTENLNFGGGDLQMPTEMGSSLMYMNYLLQRNFMYSKDNFNRFPATYVENLKSLTSFEISISPVILTNVNKQGETESQVYKYKAEYLDAAKWATVPIPWAYLLTNRRVIAKGIEKQMFLPVTKFRYLQDTWGYVWALDLRYQSSDSDDGLKGNNAKVVLDSLYQQELDNCYLGENGTGLSAFFDVSNPDFKGFVAQTGIAFKRDLQDKFDSSVKDAFRTYWGSTIGGHKPDPNACEETLKGIGLIVSGAAMINGYWLPQAAPYLNY